jgi:hypothetical protein
MASGVIRGVRWAAAPIVGAFAALVVQYAVYQGTLELVGVAALMRSRDWFWAAKAFTSLFMGAAFVAAVWWVVPSAKRHAAVAALGVVIMWGGRLILGGLGDDGTLWSVAMGTLGILGGVAAVLMSRRSLKVAA